MSDVRVLDHGYVRFVEAWGSDQRIVEAARMSTQKGFLGWGHNTCDACGGNFGEAERCPNCGDRHKVSRHTGDERLLRYLYENGHATPFEMAGLVIEVQAPIFVFREWHRHRTQSYNEMSARYAPLPDLNYLPTVARVMLGGGHLTKQAAGTGAVVDEQTARHFIDRVAQSYLDAQRLYELALAGGVPKDLARVHLPVGRYSRMRASANLRNWLGFLTLRMAPNAQWEIREYANAVGALVAEHFPRTWQLFAKAAA